jgi:hypothetical protein
MHHIAIKAHIKKQLIFGSWFRMDTIQAVILGVSAIVSVVDG